MPSDIISPFRAAFRTDPKADAGEPFVAPRPRGSRRPHTDGKVKAVRHLIETTTLTYGEIAARTGVGRASICRWTRDGGWTRPAFAPRATDTVPTARASAKLRRRTLSHRLTALAERAIRELEEAPVVDLDKLAQALELLKMTRLSASGRKRSRVAAGTLGEPMRPIAELCVAGVELDRAPKAALDDFLKNRATPREEDKPPRPGRNRHRGAEYYWRMRESERS
jgi:hypothetical protein